MGFTFSQLAEHILSSSGQDEADTPASALPDEARSISSRAMAAATDASGEASAAADPAALFDPVGSAQLEKMFPDNGRWASYTERAARNGLKDAAKSGRGKFNPYRAANWWLSTQNPNGWDWARCRRALANNLPHRSVDSAAMLSDYSLRGEY